ncbi:MAG: aconitate hydratase [Defluviitaleaceae bacterium]|nr:aconitate hydratase [Defluviitaleaceae bacterium]
MKLTITEKIIKAHLTDGEMGKGKEIGLKIDQTLTQDSTGTMAYLQLEAMEIGRVKTKLSVAYIDHNMLQEGFENPDDHRYIQTVAYKHGIYFSRPGNGICHQVHLERFAEPGGTLLGSDSHTPTCGGIGMLAMGAGGLDVAVAMGGGAYYITMPEIVNVRLTGRLKPFVTAKDIILEVLRRMSVKGGVGKVIEYTGEGVKALSVPERATITNMGAELGATASVFPSDENTRAFLEAQGRGEVFVPLAPDENCAYDCILEIDLDALEPLCSAPHSPDNVVRVASGTQVKVDQVAIGSCTNGSYADLMKVAAILKGGTVHPGVSLVISPGSKQVLTMLARNGALADLVAAGARILESGCGPCIGMGQAPATNAVSLRTFNRNFKGRCGTESASVYLVSPETAAVSALTGYLTDPRTHTGDISFEPPERFDISDNMIIPPSPPELSESAEVIRGPNIKPFPQGQPPEARIAKKVLIKVGDNITTDHIMPSNAKLLPYRSNIPYLAEFCLVPCDEDFPARAKEHGGGIIIGGENYGQGSSREHAALVPLYLGIKVIIAKSFARIHKANLINSGIIPLTFKNAADYDKINPLDELVIEDAVNQLKSGGKVITESPSGRLETVLAVSQKELDMLLAGGKINLMKGEANNG